MSGYCVEQKCSDHGLADGASCSDDWECNSLFCAGSFYTPGDMIHVRMYKLR